MNDNGNPTPKSWLDYLDAALTAALDADEIQATTELDTDHITLVTDAGQVFHVAVTYLGTADTIRKAR